MSLLTVIVVVVCVFLILGGLSSRSVREPADELAQEEEHDAMLDHLQSIEQRLDRVEQKLAAMDRQRSGRDDHE